MKSFSLDQQHVLTAEERNGKIFIGTGMNYRSMDDLRDADFAKPKEAFSIFWGLLLGLFWVAWIAILAELIIGWVE